MLNYNLIYYLRSRLSNYNCIFHVYIDHTQYPYPKRSPVRSVSNSCAYVHFKSKIFRARNKSSYFKLRSLRPTKSWFSSVSHFLPDSGIFTWNIKYNPPSQVLLTTDSFDEKSSREIICSSSQFFVPSGSPPPTLLNYPHSRYKPLLYFHNRVFPTMQNTMILLLIL